MSLTKYGAASAFVLKESPRELDSGLELRFFQTQTLEISEVATGRDLDSETVEYGNAKVLGTQCKVRWRGALYDSKVL